MEVREIFKWWHDSICFHCWWCANVNTRNSSAICYNDYGYQVHLFCPLMGCFSLRMCVMCHKHKIFLPIKFDAEILFEFVKHPPHHHQKYDTVVDDVHSRFIWATKFSLFYQKRQFHDVMSICYTCSIYHQHKKRVK